MPEPSLNQRRGTEADDTKPEPHQMTRDLNVLILILGVPIANILLNYMAQATARTAGSYLTSLLSWQFGVAFVVGSVSILVMVALYRTGVALGSGIILMGAVSIVGGAIIGMLRDSEWLPVPELFLLGTIVVLFSYRWLTWASRS